MESSVPPTLTMATPSRLALTPRRVTAPRTATGMCREDRSRVNFCCTNGTTNTPPPTTTFWPLLSVKTRPVSGSVDLLAAPPGDDERLAGPRDLVAGDDDQREQDEEYDDSDDGDDDWTHGEFPP